MKFEKSCGAIIFDNEKVLILQQTAGHWGFPKGHVEAGESEIETAKREIKEETNLDVEIIVKYRYSEKYSPLEGVEKEVVYFLAHKTGGEVKAQEGEVQQIEWLDYNEAIERLTFENSKELLKIAWNDNKNVK